MQNKAISDVGNAHAGQNNTLNSAPGLNGSDTDDSSVKPLSPFGADGASSLISDDADRTSIHNLPFEQPVPWPEKWIRSRWSVRDEGLSSSRLEVWTMLWWRQCCRARGTSAASPGKSVG